MIKSRKSVWAKAVFHVYVMRLLEKSFHQFHLFGPAPRPQSDAPVLLVPNHSTWWDGFFVYLLNEKILKRDLYLMMLDSQLKKYSFFARVGAFGITPGDRDNVRESLGYAVDLLKKDNVLICMFPQGHLLPWAARPLHFQTGIESIIRQFGKPITLLPLAMRAEFGLEQRPDVYFQFGEPLPVTPASFAGVSWLEKVETDLLAELEHNIQRREKSVPLVQGRSSINAKMDRWLNRAERNQI
ncbi:MAG: lysophospholipid acyltransferase family protein [Candidatus Zhuqueibacterota bacterium]